MKKLFLIFVCILTANFGYAQLFEIGVFAGGSNYIGDIGSDSYINPNFPAGGGIIKFNYTSRKSWNSSTCQC